MKNIELFKIFENREIDNEISKFDLIRILSLNKKINFSINPILIKKILTWNKIYKSSYNTFYSKQKGYGKTEEGTFRVCDHREGSHISDKNKWVYSLFERGKWIDLENYEKENFKEEILSIFNKIKKRIDKEVRLKNLQAKINQTYYKILKINFPYIIEIDGNLSQKDIDNFKQSFFEGESQIKVRSSSGYIYLNDNRFFDYIWNEIF